MAAAGAGQFGRYLIGHVGIAGHHDGHRNASVGEPSCVVLQYFCVAAICPADEQDEVGACLAEFPHAFAGQRAGRHVDDPATRRQRHSVSGLRSDLTFITHDRDAQPAAGGGAHERLGDVSVGGELTAYRIDSVHDVGHDRGRVRCGAHHRAGPDVDEDRLGEGRPDVDAQDERHVR